MLLLAAHARPALFSALVLLCPADGPSLIAGLDELERDREAAPGGPPDREYSARFDAAALRPFLAPLDLVAAARGLPRVLLAHARDDDVVPFAHSERLAAVLAPPTEFIVLGAAVTTARAARRRSRGRRSTGCGRGEPERADAGGRVGRCGGRRRSVRCADQAAQPQLHGRAAHEEAVGEARHVGAVLDTACRTRGSGMSSSAAKGSASRS